MPGIRVVPRTSDQAVGICAVMTGQAVPVRYRATQSSLRPPRAVTLLSSDGDWRADALRMLECYSRTWGGDGNGLVACSGTWEIAGGVLDAIAVSTQIGGYSFSPHCGVSGCPILLPMRRRLRTR